MILLLERTESQSNAAMPSVSSPSSLGRNPSIPGIASIGNGQYSNASRGQRPREKAVIVDEVTVSEKEQHAGLVEFALAGAAP